MSGQSRACSLLESIANVASGYIISLVLWSFVVAPVFEVETNMAQNFGITLAFTVISLARSYAWRRLFNRIHETRA